MDKICSICGSNKSVINYKRQTLLCARHRSQMMHCGKILNKTRFDKNEIIIKKDIAEIVLYDKNGNIKKEKGIIDLIYVDKIKNFRWFLDGRGYLEAKKIGKLHRFLMGNPEGYDIDHKNCDKMDNRIENLRKCIKKQNNCNKKIGVTNTSGIKGVSWDNSHNAWRSFISVNCKRIQLGYRKNIDDAIKLRKDAEEKYHGEFAYQG